MKSLTPSDPRVLGDIEILDRLGAGGMGVVYLGRTAEDELVAVKTLLPHDADRDDVRARFDREATALGVVQGPGVAALVAVSQDPDEIPWLAMQYVPGVDLASFLKGHDPLDELTAAAFGLVIATALAEVHGAGLTHRDLKPGNIMLGPEGPRVVDFGLVAIGGAGGDLTASGAMLGTPRFMAPEQFTAPTEVTGAADVYALGAMLAYACSGRHAFSVEAPHALAMAIVDPGSAPDLDGVPDSLRSLVAELMSKAPGGRPSLTDVRARLTEFLGAAGLSPSAARLRVAERTYVPGTDVVDEVRPERKVPVAPQQVAATVPSSSGPGRGRAARAASRLRKAYARPAAP